MVERRRDGGRDGGGGPHANTPAKPIDLNLPCSAQVVAHSLRKKQSATYTKQAGPASRAPPRTPPPQRQEKKLCRHQRCRTHRRGLRIRRPPSAKRRPSQRRRSQRHRLPGNPLRPRRRRARQRRSLLVGGPSQPPQQPSTWTECNGSVKFGFATRLVRTRDQINFFTDFLVAFQSSYA